MKDEDYKYFIKGLITNISHHNLVPKHEIISDKDKEYLKNLITKFRKTTS